MLAHLRRNAQITPDLTWKSMATLPFDRLLKSGCEDRKGLPWVFFDIISPEAYSYYKSMYLLIQFFISKLLLIQQARGYGLLCHLDPLAVLQVRTIVPFVQARKLRPTDRSVHKAAERKGSHPEIPMQGYLLTNSVFLSIMCQVFKKTNKQTNCDLKRKRSCLTYNF